MAELVFSGSLAVNEHNTSSPRKPSALLVPANPMLLGFFATSCRLTPGRPDCYHRQAIEMRRTLRNSRIASFPHMLRGEVLIKASPQSHLQLP